uniref:Uncharacterized protein n=1 Tax=Aegilops tauschii TaxID=37682 RepID=M8CV38_AEGTA
MATPPSSTSAMAGLAPPSTSPMVTLVPPFISTMDAAAFFLNVRKRPIDQEPKSRSKWRTVKEEAVAISKNPKISFSGYHILLCLKPLAECTNLLDALMLRSTSPLVDKPTNRRDFDCLQNWLRTADLERCKGVSLEPEGEDQDFSQLS